MIQILKVQKQKDFEVWMKNFVQKQREWEKIQEKGLRKWNRF